MAVSATPLGAQYADGLRIGFAHQQMESAVPVLSSQPLRLPDKYPATHWKTGALVTTIPAILAFNLLYGDEDDATIFGRIIGTGIVGVVFAVPGAVIGGLFPKGTDRGSGQD